MKYLSIAAVVLSLTWVQAYAGPLEIGMAAANNGNYEQAIDVLQPLADQGNAEAQLMLGIFYSKGQGVEQDYNKAASLFRRAADQGNKKAKYNLGLSYALGRGVPQDQDQAQKWFMRAKD